MSRLRDAMEFMKTGNHVGKLVMTNYQHDEDGNMQPVSVRALEVGVFKSRPDNKTILVTGGNGGFGHHLITDLAIKKGARHFIITTRNGDSAEIRRRFKHVLDLPGATIQFVKADLSIKEDTERVIEIARAADPPLKVVYHAAGISVDRTLHEMGMEDFHKVADCKALAAWHLHESTKDLDLEDFIVISSTASIMGLRGVGMYASANSFLSGLIRYRRSLGLPGTSLAMHAVVDVGLIAESPDLRRMQNKLGFSSMYAQEAVDFLLTGLRCGLDVVFTLPTSSKYFHLLTNTAPYSHLDRKPLLLGMTEGISNEQLQPADVVAILIQEIQSIIGKEEVSPSTQLISLGLDSFSFVSTF